MCDGRTKQVLCFKGESESKIFGGWKVSRHFGAISWRSLKNQTILLEGLF